MDELYTITLDGHAMCALEGMLRVAYGCTSVILPPMAEEVLELRRQVKEQLDSQGLTEPAMLEYAKDALAVMQEFYEL